MKDELTQSCKQCEYNHISIDCCWCDWHNKVSIDTTYFQKKNDGIPDYCPLNILYIALKTNDMKDLRNAKQKELIELLDRYFLSKTRPSLDELIEYEDLKSELAELEQEREEETLMLDIALDIVFLKYGDDCVQDINFNTDLGKVYDFIQNFVDHFTILEQESKEHSEKLGYKETTDSLNQFLNKKQPSAEEILDKLAKENMVNIHNMLPTKEIVLIAMRTYAKAYSKQSRGKIIKDWMEWYYEDCGGIDDYTKKYIKQYLNP